MFKISEKVKSPRILLPIQKAQTVSMEGRTYKGMLHKVRPTNAKEVFALQMLEHRVEKFAPENGNGIFITPAALAKLNA